MGAGMSGEEKMANVEAELFGNKQRFRIYWFMLTRGEPVGVREIQRGLGISSPSVVSFHLDRLKRVGVVGSDEYGRYVLNTKVEIGILQGFTRVGGFMLPRFTFYAVFFTTAVLVYLILYGAGSNVFASLFGGLGAAFGWYEAYRVWRKRPF
jgi:predicted DNA-binding transcriptional regulator